MYLIDTSIEIDAPPQRVWSLLMDFARYKRWNPSFPSIDGTPATGKSLDVVFEPADARTMRFRVSVLKCEPGRELRWRGSFLIPGVLAGEHYFRLEPKS